MIITEWQLKLLGFLHVSALHIVQYHAMCILVFTPAHSSTCTCTLLLNQSLLVTLALTCKVQTPIFGFAVQYFHYSGKLNININFCHTYILHASIWNVGPEVALQSHIESSNY